jgi:hypothetical protein
MCRHEEFGGRNKHDVQTRGVCSLQGGILGLWPEEQAAMCSLQFTGRKKHCAMKNLAVCREEEAREEGSRIGAADHGDEPREEKS